MTTLSLVLLMASAVATPQAPSVDQKTPQSHPQVAAAAQPGQLASMTEQPGAAGRGTDETQGMAPADWNWVEPRHRLEARFGVWRKPHFSFSEPTNDVHVGSADFAFGFEYLRSVTRDLAIGIGTQTFVRGTGESVEDGDSSSTGYATVAIPFVVRWTFARRLTSWRTIEPYLTAGVGPLIRMNWTAFEFDDDSTGTADGEATIGGRVGLGLDVHIGSVWTLGAMAGWNFSEKPDSVTGYGRHDRGGEVAVTMGWVFGRESSRHD